MEQSGGVVRHALMVQQMAEVAGVDLADAALEGRLSGEDMREAVVRCRNCTDTGACGEMLEAAAAGAAMTLPGWCRNADWFAALGSAGA